MKMVDELYIKAMDLALRRKKISVTMLRKEFNIGYSKSGEIIDWMEKHNYIGKFNGTKYRDVILDSEDMVNIYDDIGNSEIVIPARNFYIMGVCFMNGIEVERNVSAALSCFKAAADKDYTKAQYALGLIYMTGLTGTDVKDEGRAFYYFNKAAEAGSRQAQQKLAFCYGMGIGTAKDDEKAKLYDSKSNNKGGKQFILSLTDDKIYDDDL